MFDPAGWPNALNPRRSPCRIDTEKGRHQHRCSRVHADLVREYRTWRDTEHDLAETATLGYAKDLAAYWETRERPTFRNWLIMSRRNP